MEVMDCHGSGVTLMQENQELVNQLNHQIYELESLMERLHYSLSELRLADPNNSAASVSLFEPSVLEFPPARISLC